MNIFTIAWRQVIYENKVFWRNPVAAFFTFVFPLMFLSISNLLFGNRLWDLPTGTVTGSTFYVPAVLVLAVVSTCYTNIAIRVSFSRDQGLLKRIHSTPMPVWSFLLGRITHSVLLATLLVAIVTGFGVLLYDVHLPSNALPSFLLTLIIGSATFSVLGLSITTIIPNGDSSPAIVNASILPLLFISDVLVPLQNAPAWLTTVANIFPVRHFALALHSSYNPLETGVGLEPLHLLVMILWLTMGLIITARFFSWSPKR